MNTKRESSEIQWQPTIKKALAHLKRIEKRNAKKRSGIMKIW